MILFLKYSFYFLNISFIFTFKYCFSAQIIWVFFEDFFFFSWSPRFLLCAFRLFFVCFGLVSCVKHFLIPDDLETSIQIKKIDIFETRQKPMETHGLPKFLLPYEGLKLPSHWENALKGKGLQSVDFLYERVEASPVAQW